MDVVLGLLFLAVYIVGIVSLAAAITYGVIKIFPTERKPKDDGEPAAAAKPANGGETRAGALYRRAKRGKS